MASFHHLSTKMAHDQVPIRHGSARCLNRHSNLLLAACALFAFSGPFISAQTVEQAARGIQDHLDRMKSLKAQFRQIYEANSIRQEESGTLWLKMPARMRWEYEEPESKIFLADGKTTYFYVPSANQVSIRKLSPDDLQYTAFGFLLGQSDLQRDFELSEFSPKEGSATRLRALHLSPRRPMENISSMDLEFDPETMSVSALTIHEFTGGTNRFEFSQIEENPRLPKGIFRFKRPKGVEIVKIEEPE